MPPRTTSTPGSPIRIVLATTSLLSLVSSRRAVVLVLLELGGAAFFASGVAERAVGPAAPWLILVAVLMGILLRAADLENCALFIPGGVYGTVKEALGKPVAKVAASALLVQHFVLGALAAVAAGHYVAVLIRPLLGAGQLPREITTDDVATAVAVCLLGVNWWWKRQGRALSHTSVRWAVTAALTFVAAIIVWSVISLAGRRGTAVPLPSTGVFLSYLLDRWSAMPPVLSAPAAFFTALGYCLFALGGIHAFSRVAPEVPQPRIRHLRRIAWLTSAYALVATAGVAFLVGSLVPAEDRSGWFDTPIVGLVLHLRAPLWVRLSLLPGLVAAAGVILIGAVLRATLAAQSVLSRLSQDGVLSPQLRALHSRFGTASHLMDLTAAAQLVIVLLSAGHVSWLARAYAMGVVASGVLEVAALVRLRRLRPEPRAFRVPFNVGTRREWPVGLWSIAAIVGVPALFVLFSGDPPSLGGAALLLGLFVLFDVSERAVAGAHGSEGLDDLQLLPAADIGLDQVESRPGNLLVAVRNPRFLAHLTAALLTPGDRDVVVMTVRLVGSDTADDPAMNPRATDEERRLFAAVVSLSERHGRAVRLLIVPATNVFDAVVETVIRLRSAEIYTGESETLSADDQARLLGEAWERAPKPEPRDVRLVIFHSSGRTAVYHVGAHAPTLRSDDYHLIHSLWLDAVKAVGPHVGHDDVVRAALRHMEQQLKEDGPSRDGVLDLVRQIARPADELASAIRERDFARLRDMVRNRTASDMARVLTDLAIEDQAVAFRVLPRKMAAATFEYLSREDQEALLKAMAQEEVAALLNNMAPDDRTMFLEELPAGATRQLLSLLTPDERAVAVTLLGYPEGSIGRLMTPDYIAVQEHWTVQEVLDYVRAHGHDSETLNVIYVVDDRGVLIDDVRIREFLLTALTTKVSELMDRRFVALKATDDQVTAVAVFRTEDRTALPVTDSAGVLIGIVTIDDMLDVAEAAATKEIQRIGGSEALEEPYIQIAFGRMIQKRAGWLTALFLGEMLTATAMGFFEREIERAVVLALFVPLIISSGGNSGSQASTLVIRAIALGEVQLRDWWRVARREIAAGLALGSILGSIGFMRIALWSTFSSLYGPHWLLVALTVGVALVGVVLWGTLVGSLLPFALRRLGFDPATSSAPFVATLVDVTGLVIYFSVGLVILRGTLL
jgi:magnesium transporter